MTRTPIDRAARIMRALLRGPQTAAAIAEATGTTPKRLGPWMSALRREGVIVQAGREMTTGPHGGHGYRAVWMLAREDRQC